MKYISSRLEWRLIMPDIQDYLGHLGQKPRASERGGMI